MKIKDRKIIHLDMDAFYASIEERDNPSLIGKPLIIGAAPGHRGVVSTCNYEARKYGVRSAMSSEEAYRRCPKGIFMRPNPWKYVEASKKVHEIMYAYTDVIEFVSLDEGYMDVTGSLLLFGSAANIARELQRRVFEAVGVTCSVGIGYSMMSAKLASEEKKPRGFFEISDANALRALISDRPIRVIPGVGKKMAAHLASMGIYTVRDILTAPNHKLSGLGAHIKDIVGLANGIDDREVVAGAQAKSIGKETTFSDDVTDREILLNELAVLSSDVSYRLKMKGILCKTVTLKIKYYDFKTITRADTGALTDSSRDIYTRLARLLENNPPSKAVRLIGVTSGNLTSGGYEQIKMGEDLEKSERQEKLEKTLAELYRLHGRKIIGTAREISGRKNKNLFDAN